MAILSGFVSLPLSVIFPVMPNPSREGVMVISKAASPVTVPEYVTGLSGLYAGVCSDFSELGLIFLLVNLPFDLDSRNSTLNIIGLLSLMISPRFVRG